jgi:hypothetical protein
MARSVVVETIHAIPVQDHQIWQKRGKATNHKCKKDSGQSPQVLTLQVPETGLEPARPVKVTRPSTWLECQFVALLWCWNDAASCEISMACGRYLPIVALYWRGRRIANVFTICLPFYPR